MPAPGPAATRRPVAPQPVQYKGADLDPARGPGLGCFYVQLALLVALLIATPLTVSAGFPPIVSMALLVAIIVLLLFAGQTMIFLLRLVAAERGRRRPLAAASRTVGDMEAEEPAVESAEEPVGPDEASAGRAVEHVGPEVAPPGSAGTGGEGDGALGGPEHGGSVRE